MLLYMISNHQHYGLMVHIPATINKFKHSLETNQLTLSLCTIFDLTFLAASFNNLVDTIFADGIALGAAVWRSQNNFLTSRSSHD